MNYVVHVHQKVLNVLRKVFRPTFFKFTQMQSISILSGFIHPCPFLAFLCFVGVLLKFGAVILIF